MLVNGAFTQKEKELVAVGASIAAGCRPCTAHHFKAARAAGASEEEIRQAVDDALCVRNSATKIMTGVAEKHLGNGRMTEESCCSEKPLIGELVSIGAALAVNCTANLETHLKAARAVGATERQVQIALGVARAVKKIAGQKVEAVVAEPAGPVETEADDGCDDDCGCGEEESVGAATGAAVEPAKEPCCG